MDNIWMNRLMQLCWGLIAMLLAAIGTMSLFYAIMILGTSIWNSLILIILAGFAFWGEAKSLLVMLRYLRKSDDLEDK